MQGKQSDALVIYNFPKGSQSVITHRGSADICCSRHFLKTLLGLEVDEAPLTEAMDPVRLVGMPPDPVVLAPGGVDRDVLLDAEAHVTHDVQYHNDMRGLTTSCCRSSSHPSHGRSRSPHPSNAATSA